MLANELGAFVAEARHGSFPATVLDAAKLRILDVLAASIAASRLSAHAGVLSLFAGREDATVWGIGRKLPLRDAVLMNSFLAHALYQEDGSRHTGGHPSSAVIPAAIGVGEVRQARGRDLLASVVAGYEIFLRLGRAIYPSTVTRGFQSTAVLGAVSAAAACSSLLALDAGRTKNALAIASTFGVGLKEALKSPESQPLQVARSVEGGVMAAQLAHDGLCGSDGILEQGFLKAFADNASTEQILNGLGSEFRISETYLKRHGGGRSNHAPVDLIQTLVRAHGIEAKDIAHISLGVDSVTYAAETHEPATAKQAQFCIRFAVALMLVEGDASVLRYNERAVADPRIRRMMERICVRAEPALDPAYPQKRGARAEIGLTDGRRFDGVIDNARGEPEDPFSRLEIEMKFMTLAGPTLGRNAPAVRDMVMGLEELRDVRDLLRVLKPDDVPEG